MKKQRQDQIIQKKVGEYLITQHQLGRGQYGEVVLAKSEADPSKLFACKVMTKQLLARGRNMQQLQQEIGILRNISSPNVIKLIDIQETQNNWYLIMEYCNGGDLEDILASRVRFDEKEARYILSQIIKGFKAISQEKVVHRDLKLANVLIHFEDKSENETLGNRKEFRKYKYTCSLTENVKIVIADLGFAKQLKTDHLT